MKCDDVRAAQKGDNNAFIRIVKEYEKTMYRIARAILKSDGQCADAIQETIMKAFQSIKSLREPAYFKTWLTRILVNECTNILRVESKVIPMEVLEERPTRIDEYERLEIQDAIEYLEDELKILITLFYYEDIPLKEISILLNMPEGTVKSRLHRARIKLAESLGIHNERSVCHE